MRSSSGFSTRDLELPQDDLNAVELQSIIRSPGESFSVPVTEGDVHEALVASKLPCTSKAELRYQLACAVALNTWIENERRLGFGQRKKFYAFKERIGTLAKWAAESELSGVRIWSEPSGKSWRLYIRVDDVDFSFQEIPGASCFRTSGIDAPQWSGIRLKPIAPLVLKWARSLRKS